MDQNKKLSQKVYDVEKEKVKVNERLEDTDYIVLGTVDTDRETIGSEASPKENSMQAMTVGKIKDEYKSLDFDDLKDISGYPESVLTKDLKIVYAGTASAQDWKSNGREIFFNDKHSDGAFQSALDYAKIVKDKYKGYNISTTGHSLGGAEAIYVAVLLGFDAITYGAAGSGLTDEQMKKYKGNIFNIYDTSDGVTSGWLTGGKHKIPFHSFGIDNYSGFGKGWADNTFGHGLDLFKVDNNGNYIDKYGDVVVYSDLNGGISLEATLIAQKIIANNERLRELEGIALKSSSHRDEIDRLQKENSSLQFEISMVMAMNGLEVVRRKFTSNGNLTRNEQIYLDDSQALITIQQLQSEFDLATESVVRIYQDGIEEAESLWSSSLSKAQSQGSLLSSDEIIDSLSSTGFTQRVIVNVPCEDYQEKINKIRNMGNSFINLTTNIKEQINRLVQNDHELENELRQIG